MRKFLSDVHGIETTGEFAKLPIDFQRAVAAGMDDAVARFGVADVSRVASMSSARDDGLYDPQTGIIKVDRRAPDPYIVAYHEAVHGIDAAKSASLDIPKGKNPPKWYNVASRKAVEDALKKLGMRTNSKAYRDMVFQIADLDPRVYDDLIKKPYELVAYSVDHERMNRGNTLSKAIMEAFENA